MNKYASDFCLYTVFMLPAFILLVDSQTNLKEYWNREARHI